MSAHEFMNMARVRAEQAEARAERAEAALQEIGEVFSKAPPELLLAFQMNAGIQRWLTRHGFGDAS